MFKFVAVFCLCSVAYCNDPYPMKMTHPVVDKEWCKTGFYQEPADPCCWYQQCEADKLSAYNRSCFCDGQELFWNTELCACDYSWINGSCDETLNYLCEPEFVVPMEECVATGPYECCLKGVAYDDHTEGYGPLYVKDDEDDSKYYIPEWHDYGYCPEPGTFSVKYCACEHLNTTCSCAHWNFSAPEPLLDDGTYMSEGNCEADGDGQLVCHVPDPNDGIVPAEIPATQKIYFGNTGTIFGMVDVNFDGTVVTNESPEAKPPMGHSIKIEIIDCTLSVWLEYQGIQVAHVVDLPDATKARVQNGEGFKKSFYVVVENGNLTTCFGVLFDDGTYEENHWEEELPAGFKLAGNKCPFKLGFTRPALYFDFGYCVFAWTSADWKHYLHDGIVPPNPNPGKGSWHVFADWNDVAGDVGTTVSF